MMSYSFESVGPFRRYGEQASITPCECLHAPGEAQRGFFFSGTEKKCQLVPWKPIKSLRMLATASRSPITQFQFIWFKNNAFFRGNHE